MNEQGLKPTAIADIALPVEVVEIKQWKTKDGRPVYAQCERIDRLEMTRITKRLPGLRENLVSPGADVEDQLDNFRPLGSLLIEKGVFLLDEMGRPKRPSFYSTDPVAGCVPVSLLDAEDFVNLSNTILRLRGYLGGAADDGGFPARVAGGDGERARAVDGGQGDGMHAEGGAGAPGPAVHADVPEVASGVEEGAPAGASGSPA